MQGIARQDKPKTEDEVTLIRVEANLEELPIFGAAKRSRREEVVEWTRTGRDPHSHRPIEQRVTLRPAVGLGLPAERECDVYYLVIATWLEEHGFGPEGRIGPIRYQDACRMLGWKRSGRSYELLRQALKTLVSTQLEFENAIMDGSTRRLLERGGGLFTEYAMYGESSIDTPDRVRRGIFSLQAAPWFVANWEANYRKPIDKAVYCSLSGLAKQIYRYLDKRAWRRNGYIDEVAEDLHELRERFRLGVRRTDHLLEVFRRAHEQLQRAWPRLQETRFQKLMPGRYRVVYLFNSQVTLALDAGDQPGPEAAETGTAQTDLIRELVFRGLHKERAKQLVETHDEQRIRLHVDVHDQELKRRSDIQKPAAWLYLRITQNWEPFDGYKPRSERRRASKAREAEIDQARATEREIEAERAAWRALPAEERAQKRTQRWADFQAAIGRPLSDTDRDALYEKHLAEEQRVKDEKQQDVVLAG